MPPKKAAESPKEAAECILRIGKYNNVVQWRKAMESSVTELYGRSGQFLITNERYVPRLPREEDYTPVYPPVAEGEPPNPVVNAALLTKLREACSEARRKKMDKQEEHERNIYAMMWTKMSIASQSKVEEEEGFEQAHIDLDSVRLWGFIRRTHLTHIFGVGDPVMEVNVQEQESRYAVLRQGDRESIHVFKVRFDNQIKANQGAGIADVTESKRALEFIYRLDGRRYKPMLVSMRNDALRQLPDAYPQTLAAAFRIAAGWLSEDHGLAQGVGEIQNAYVTDTALVTKARDPEKGAGTASGKTSVAPAGKKKSSSKVTCFVCGV